MRQNILLCWYMAQVSRRGISHADEVDARRMNLTRETSENGISDIREFYINVVSGLKQMGM